MIKVTVLYGHPKDAGAFEKYYEATHMPLVGAMKGIAKAELTKIDSGADGGKADFYRMAEMYFESAEQMQETLGSPEGKAAVGDLPNFATGGATMLVGTVQG
jgi:uncharacterized protein (TIGR02118 family)